jgi:hypothetical protein
MKTQNLDNLLVKYKYEMENDGNDGWTKIHYARLYEEELAKLKRIPESWNPSDGPESPDEL